MAFKIFGIITILVKLGFISRRTILKYGHEVQMVDFSSFKLRFFKLFRLPVLFKPELQANSNRTDIVSTSIQFKVKHQNTKTPLISQNRTESSTGWRPLPQLSFCFSTLSIPPKVILYTQYCFFFFSLSSFYSNVIVDTVLKNLSSVMEKNKELNQKIVDVSILCHITLL